MYLCVCVHEGIEEHLIEMRVDWWARWGKTRKPYGRAQVVESKSFGKIEGVLSVCNTSTRG